MFCSKCGAEFPGNAQFCVQCGASAPGRPSAAFDGVEQNPYATPTQANVNINTYLIPNIWLRSSVRAFWASLAVSFRSLPRTRSSRVILTTPKAKRKSRASCFGPR